MEGWAVWFPEKEQLCSSPDNLKSSWVGYNAPKDKEKQVVSVTETISGCWRMSSALEISVLLLGYFFFLIELAVEL